MFNLSKDYVIKFKRGDKVFKHVLKQPNVEDVYLHEKKKRTPLEIRQGEITQDSDNVSGDIYLWDLLVKSVEGYGNLGKDWKSKVPVLDKYHVVRTFGKVKVLDENDVISEFGKDQIISDTFDKTIVYLSARQDREEILLTHIFSQPSERQLAEFVRINSFSKIKNKRNKAIIFDSLETKPLVDLYDQLISDFKGYILSDSEDTSTIKEKISPIHKILAVKEIFALFEDEFEDISGN